MLSKANLLSVLRSLPAGEPVPSYDDLLRLCAEHHGLAYQPDRAAQIFKLPADYHADPLIRHALRERGYPVPRISQRD